MSNELHIEALRALKSDMATDSYDVAIDAGIAAMKLQDATNKGSKAGELIARVFECAEAIDQAPYPADGWLQREADFEKACWNAFIDNGNGTVKSAQSMLTMLAMVEQIRSLNDDAVLKMAQAWVNAGNGKGGYLSQKTRVRELLEVLCRVIMTGSPDLKSEKISMEPANVPE